MAVFGLLHGGFEGAWCWDLLRPELHQLGHETLAVDLPIDDVTATWDDHVDAVLRAFAGRQVIVVAHSRAGRMVPRLLERGTFGHVILLGAGIPGGICPPPYHSAGVPVTGTATRSRTVDELGRTVITEEAAARIFSDCSPEIRAWAMSRARPMCELPAVPDDTRWPPVDVAYIYGADEQVLDPAWIQRACPERLGIEPIVMPGAHSLFLSRPRELAGVLDSIASGWSQ